MKSTWRSLASLWLVKLMLWLACEAGTRQIGQVQHQILKKAKIYFMSSENFVGHCLGISANLTKAMLDHFIHLANSWQTSYIHSSTWKVTAIVTGKLRAFVNIGLHCVIGILRAGADVISNGHNFAILVLYPLPLPDVLFFAKYSS